MGFAVLGLDPPPFRSLYGLSDEELARRGARRVIAAEGSRMPDRIEVRDLRPGESAILLNYLHQPADTAYRASHAIFVRKGAEHRYEAVNTIPEAIRTRFISLRGFDAAGEMLDATLVDGSVVDGAIERMLDDPAVDYLHAHYATRGCYAALIRRISRVGIG